MKRYKNSAKIYKRLENLIYYMYYLNVCYFLGGSYEFPEKKEDIYNCFTYFVYVRYECDTGFCCNKIRA